MPRNMFHFFNFLCKGKMQVIVLKFVANIIKLCMKNIQKNIHPVANYLLQKKMKLSVMCSKELENIQ
jgi:hypothetical protein